MNPTKGIQQIVRRFEGGYQKAGAIVRKPDARSEKELVNNIKHYAEEIPEVKEFLPQIKDMNKAQLGLVSDTIELSRGDWAMGLSKVNYQNKLGNGKTILANVLEKIGFASKNNPKSIEFANEVVNNTDGRTAKYFLANFTKAFETPELGSHFDAARPLIKPIANETLGGMPTLDFAKQDSFIDMLGNYTNTGVDAKKLKIVDDVAQKIDSIMKRDTLFDISSFVYGKQPVSAVQENLVSLEKHMAPLLKSQNRDIDIAAYLSNNVNLY